LLSLLCSQEARQTESAPKNDGLQQINQLLSGHRDAGTAGHQVTVSGHLVSGQ